MRASNTSPLLTSQFDYELPPGLIPDRPNRGKSRLLALGPERGAQHTTFRTLPTLLRAGDLLIFNDTRVLRARLRGHRILNSSRQASAEVGGAVEALLVEPIEHDAFTHMRHHASSSSGTARAGARSRWRAMLRPGKRQRPGQKLVLAGLEVVVNERDGDLFELTFQATPEQVHAAMEQYGELPLPPYLGRVADQRDDKDYQTLFAHKPGAVAAPTAGLHFDDALLAELGERGIEQQAITLHVGPGTFRPVKADDVRQHVMDAERYHIPSATADAIRRTKANGGRVIAVGTTVTRTLEGAHQHNPGLEGSGRTELFITPGHTFNVIDGLITNFHLPRSTLLMLVAALIGRQRTLDAYAEAVAAQYQFYSYGDAMLVWKKPEPCSGPESSND